MVWIAKIPYRKNLFRPKCFKILTCLVKTDKTVTDELLALLKTTSLSSLNMERVANKDSNSSVLVLSVAIRAKSS